MIARADYRCQWCGYRPPRSAARPLTCRQCRGDFPWIDDEEQP